MLALRGCAINGFDFARTTPASTGVQARGADEGGFYFGEKMSEELREDGHAAAYYPRSDFGIAI